MAEAENNAMLIVSLGKAAGQAGIGFEELVWRVLEQTVETRHA